MGPSKTYRAQHHCVLNKFYNGDSHGGFFFFFKNNYVLLNLYFQ